MPLLFLLVSGCLINDAFYEAQRPRLIDDDGDGVTEVAGDCDDADSAIHPDADERCNRRDDDCDGATDEASDLVDADWYPDSDDDGFGGGDAVVTCEPAGGMVQLSGDCDDIDPEAFPGAPERCNAADDDCDGAVDEEGEVQALDWYADADGDDYGTGDAIASCAPPEGTVRADGDCEDADPEINPGATEVCNGVDDDCNGASDDADAIAWFLDRDDDGYGDDDDVYMVCTPPPGYAPTGGDCDDLDGERNPGEHDACEDGFDADCDGLEVTCGIPTGDADIDDASALFEGGLGETYAARTVVSAGDLDGDGDDELLVARLGYDDFRGEVRVLSGAPDLFQGAYALDDVGSTVSGASAGAAFGGAVHAGVDIDGDGVGEVLIGEAFERHAYIFGGAELGRGSLTTADAQVTLVGDPDGAFGFTLALVGDVDSDGWGDWIVGDWEYAETGAAYLYYGDGTGGRIESNDPRARELLGADGDHAGFRVGRLGDVDGDGFEDFAAATNPEDPYAPSYAYGFTGSPTRTDAGPLEDAPYRLEGEVGANAFRNIAALGDLNGDGRADVAYSADDAADGVGQVYAVFGTFSLEGRFAVADIADVTWTGGASDANFGACAAGVGDLDGDGFDDVAASTPRAEGIESRTYVFSGSASPSASYTTTDATVGILGTGSEMEGVSISGPLDANGDGALDLLLGGVGRTGTEGAAWLIYGAP